jgi:probable rRNA maturation factor
MLDVDCDIVAGAWDEGLDWAGLAAGAVGAALVGGGFAHVLEAPDLAVEVSVRLTDDADVARLNRDYRGKDRPTNILSFPMHAPDALAAMLRSKGADLLLGDLALAEETIAREAADRAIPVADHVTHLLVHGTLHLLGHDHQDDAAADRMEALETRILAGLGIADPYAAALRLAVDEEP